MWVVNWFMEKIDQNIINEGKGQLMILFIVRLKQLRSLENLIIYLGRIGLGKLNYL